MFDGEGSSYIIKVEQAHCNGFQYRSGVSLGNTYKPLILELHRIYGGSWRERPPHNGKLPMFEWEMKRQEDQEKFLLDVLPYLKTKREQSKILLNFIRMRGERNPAKREEMHRQVRALNGKKIESELHGDMQSAPLVTATA